ncbi:MAG: flagellar hook-length control protein FliK, partial [Bacillota bacterium]
PDPGLNPAALAPSPTDNPVAAHHSHGAQDEAGVMAATSGAMRRSVGIEPDGARRAAASIDEAAPDAEEFDARLAQAKDEKAATAGGKAPLQYADPAAAQRAERPAAKSIQDLQPPAAAQINGSALTAPPQLQPAAMPAQAAEMLAPRVGSQGWDQALGQKVVWMVSSDVQSASLTLNPPDLGPLQIVLHVSDNQATASFTAAQPEVRHALESALPRLREMLGDAGIQLSQANVNAGNPNSNPQNAFGQPQQPSRSGSAGGQPDENSDAPIARTGRGQTIASGRGLVDTFV